MADLEVSVGGELVEVMAGNVGVNGEQLGDGGARHRLGRLPDGDEDRPSGGVAQCRRQVADRAVEAGDSAEIGMLTPKTIVASELLNTIAIGEMVPPMPDTPPLSEAVAAVIDPLLGRTLGELGMVASVAEKRFGTDKVVVTVPVPNYPLLDELRERIESAAPGSVDVELGVMTDGAVRT
jgi:metal-sulfur cluster biosynthetic enzyme